MIELRNLSFAYKKGVNLIDNLELDIQARKIVGLLGKNGAGKTTLLRLIAGLLYPHKGVCKIMDTVSTERKSEILSKVFLIPEEFYLPPVSVKEYLAVNAGFYPKFDKDLFKSIMSEFEISTSAKLNTISFGQRKKFFVAFGLSTNAQLMLFDEPTNGLDIPSKKQFRKVVANSFTDDKLIIISTHQVKDVETLIDQILIVDNGKVLYNKSAMETTDKLAFKRNVPDLTEAIFAEEILGGNHALYENKAQEDTNIDLELLFNAVVGEPDIIKNLFNA